MATNSSSSAKKLPKAAATAAALSTMLAFNVCPTQAFQSTFLAPSVSMMHRSPSFPSPVGAGTVTMDCTPWDMECYGVHPFGDAHGGLQRHHRRQRQNMRRRQRQNMRPAPMILGPADLFQRHNAHLQQQQQQLEISDPAVVQDTDDLYALTFDLPAEVDNDGLEVSVSGRLLTVKARVTREQDSSPSSSRGGWVTRSSRTDSVSRSFVLPDGISASTAIASLSADGKAEVKFSKGKAAEGAAAAGSSSPTATVTPSTTDSAAPVEKDANDSSSASSADYLASLSRAKPSATATAADGESTATGTDAPAATTVAPTAAAGAAGAAGAAERPPVRPESPFEALDQEFREFAKAMWGEDVVESLRVPTQEELAEKAAAAKKARAKREAEFRERAKARMEARAKRRTAMRRATMATDISQAEDGSAYVVKVALPDGVTRNRVKLTVNPDNSLRVTVSDDATAAAAVEDGGRSFYRDVHLPKDALFSEISAKFEAEQDQNEGSKGNSTSKEEGRGGVEGAVPTTAATVAVANNDSVGRAPVSGLEVTVGRAVPPQPKRIDIM